MKPRATKPKRALIRPNAQLLPTLSVSLSWLAGEVRRNTGRSTFVSLLDKLAPERYARLKDKSVEGVYIELIALLRDMFPINWLAEDAVLNDEPDELISQGIPVDALGVRINSDYGDPVIDSPAIAVCLSVGSNEIIADCGYGSFECLADYLDDLPSLKGKACDPRKLRPPCWSWVEPWNAVKELYAYAHGVTGCAFMDTDIDMLYSGYATMPRWNMAEIKSLAAQWRRYAPMWERIQLLERYINTDPAENLPLLAGALINDRAAWREITYRKQDAGRRGHGARRIEAKTLCDVFTESENGEG